MKITNVLDKEKSYLKLRKQSIDGQKNSEQRDILALKYRSALSKITHSIQFKHFAIKYGLDGYSFEILSEQHRNEAIDLCCLKLARSRNILSNIVNLCPQDCKPRFITEIDHAIQTGTAFITKHIQTNKIAFIYIAFDVMDLPTYDTTKYPIAYQKRAEFLDEFPESIQLETIKNNKDVRHGQIMYGAYECGNPIFREEKLSLLTTVCNVLAYLIPIGVESIKLLIGVAVHPKTILWGKILTKVINAMNINITMEMSESKINNILIQKLKCDQWYTQNVNEEKLKEIMKHNYSFLCTKFFIHREKGIDMMEMMDKALSVMPQFMKISKM